MGCSSNCFCNVSRCYYTHAGLGCCCCCCCARVKNKIHYYTLQPPYRLPVWCVCIRASRSLRLTVRTVQAHTGNTSTHTKTSYNNTLKTGVVENGSSGPTLSSYIPPLDVCVYLYGRSNYNLSINYMYIRFGSRLFFDVFLDSFPSTGEPPSVCSALSFFFLPLSIDCIWVCYCNWAAAAHTSTAYVSLSSCFSTLFWMRLCIG